MGDEGSITLEQAIRDAITVERAAAWFYEKLSAKAQDEQTRQLLLSMCQQEKEHAEAIARMARQLKPGELPSRPSQGVFRTETAPSWLYAEDISFVEALRIALEGELSAALYYDAIADSFEGSSETFFRELSRTEEDHARQLREVLEGLGEAP